MKRIKKDIEISDLLYRSFRGETTTDEDKILEAWCLDSRNLELFTELREAENFYEGVFGMYNVDAETSFRQVEGRIKKKRRQRAIKYISGVAAVVLLGIGMMFFAGEKEGTGKEKLASFSPVERVQPVATLVTSGGKVVYLEDSVKQLFLNGNDKARSVEKGHEVDVVGVQDVGYNVLTTSRQGNIKVTLQDGSRVWLNADSELTYPNLFVGNKRVVYLKGEAFFEVAKDVRHPFCVHAGSARVEVLGTSFNVKTLESSCITTLVEGSVQMITAQRDSVKLSPGQQALVVNDGSIEVRKVNTRYYTGWMNDFFAFKDVTLRDIMDVLADWYGCTCRFENRELEEMLYTAIVKRSESIDSVLQVLSGTGDFRYARINNVVIIKEK